MDSNKITINIKKLISDLNDECSINITVQDDISVNDFIHIAKLYIYETLLFPCDSVVLTEKCLEVLESNDKFTDTFSPESNGDYLLYYYLNPEDYKYVSRKYGQIKCVE